MCGVEQITWGVRFHTAAEASQFVGELAEEVAARMAKLGVRGRCIQFKLMRAVDNAPDNMRKGSVGHGVCDTYTRSVTLPSFTRQPAGESVGSPTRNLVRFRFPVTESIAAERRHPTGRERMGSLSRLCKIQSCCSLGCAFEAAFPL